MASYFRQTGAPAAQVITLYAIFTDQTGALVDPDAIPSVYIYDESVDSATVESEADAATYTSALSGPLTATQVSTGYYKLDYTIPSGSTAGDWHDVWVASVDSVDAGDVLQFKVYTATAVKVEAVGVNTMIVITLDSTIANLAGDSTLGSDQTLHYTTTYSPLYASPDLMRMELGTWMDALPDNTLALIAHWSSKEADFINGARPKNMQDYVFARSRFVIYDAALKCLSIPGAGALSAGSASSSGGKKQLGDLLIQGASSSSGTSGTSVDDEIIDHFLTQREGWFRVVNAGGNIVPGGGFSPAVAKKGIYDPNRPAMGRLWDNPREHHYAQPTVNRRASYRGRDGRILNRGKLGFNDRWW